jgi:ubiquinone/menaquinone biosynthesis C-methylase UbiE
VAFEELKQRQSVMWGNGPYERITATIADIHDLVVDRIDPQPGERWLDLACGTGAVAERAARAGADVTGVDLAPALIETAVEKAAAAGLDITYQVGDCENLRDVETGSFDVVSSTCGVMFAPDHEATARELARVVRPGGRLALASWTPDGPTSEMFKMMSPFAPPPAPGAGSPFAWGSREHVEELLGDAYDLAFEGHTSMLELESGEENWQLFSTSYGPTKTLAESLDDERREAFHQAWVDFMESHYRVGEKLQEPREYLLVLGTRR